MTSRTCIYRRAAARRALLCAMDGAQVVPRVCGANLSLPVGAGAPTRLAKIARILAIFRRFAPSLPTFYPNTVRVPDSWRL